MGKRLAHAAPTLRRGSLSAEGVPDDALLVSDFIHWPKDSYDRYQPDATKNEARRKQALRIGKFAKAGGGAACANVQFDVWSGSL